MKPVSIIVLQFLACSVLSIPTIFAQQASCPTSNSVVPSKCYYGANFPETSEWVDFSCLFNLYRPTMLQFDSGDEVGSTWNAVKSIAQSSGLDERIIFAIIMEETGLTGDVRERLGDAGLAHGFMQAHGGADCLGTSFGGCSQDQVSAMVNSGVYGTYLTQGLLSCYQQYGENYAMAVRCYNSGRVLDPTDLTKGVGTASYVSDIGNILRGSLPSLDANTDCGFSSDHPHD